MQKDNCSSALKTTIGEFGIEFWLEMVGELSGQIYQRGSLIKKKGSKGREPFPLQFMYLVLLMLLNSPLTDNLLILRLASIEETSSS